MPKRKRSKENKARDEAEELGRQLAEQHYTTRQGWQHDFGSLSPGEPPEGTSVRRNKACAERWNELTSKYPSWYTYLAKRQTGWWIVNAARHSDFGPYDTRDEAVDDALGLDRFEKYQDVPGYVTTDKRRPKSP